MDCDRQDIFVMFPFFPGGQLAIDVSWPSTLCVCRLLWWWWLDKRWKMYCLQWTSIQLNIWDTEKWHVSIWTDNIQKWDDIYKHKVYKICVLVLTVDLISNFVGLDHRWPHNCSSWMHEFDLSYKVHDILTIVNVTDFLYNMLNIFQDNLWSKWILSSWDTHLFIRSQCIAAQVVSRYLFTFQTQPVYRHKTCGMVSDCRC